MILRCYVDETTRRLLEIASKETGRTIDELAEAAIANAASEYKRSLHSAPSSAERPK